MLFVASWQCLGNCHRFVYKKFFAKASDSSRLICCFSVAISLVAVVPRISLAALDLQAGVESGANYSDNISLERNGQESSDLVLLVKPNLHVLSKSRRSTVNLDYSLQNLSYLRNTDANSIYHQISSVGHVDFVPEMFLLDTDISRTQFSSFPAGKSSFSNFTFSDRHNVTRASISPTLKVHVQDAAQGR